MLGLSLGLGLSATVAGAAPAETFRFALEDDSGDVLLESGDYILLEIA